jgi:cytosine/adenosine deaminase-related metal-dependent hydrolase
MVQLHHQRARLIVQPHIKYALRGATLVELSPPRLRRACLVFDDSGIIEVSDTAPADATIIDCTGTWVMPGFACAHTHLYSSLARGMPPPASTPRSFVEILERVWWKLDRALDAETIELSALVGALDAAHSGCTALVDHHASPGAAGGSIDGSLDLVGGAIERVGLRGVLCYEVSDRGGRAEALAGLRENERFLARVAGERPRCLRAMVGAHAAFTLSDETAEALAALARRFDTGVHIHVAEDAIDASRSGVWTHDSSTRNPAKSVAASHYESASAAASPDGAARDGATKAGLSTVSWLAARGLLGPRALVAHAVHVSDADVAALRAAGAWVVHNPRSNANNRVGYARPSRFADRLLLGSDGIGADMRLESQAAFWLAREHAEPVDAVAALERNRAFIAEQFGWRATELEAGAPTDLVVLDYAPPTPVDETNLGGHLLFGLTGARVRHVIVDGRWVLRDGVCPHLDEAAILARARAAAAHLWSRL